MLQASLASASLGASLGISAFIGIARRVRREDGRRARSSIASGPLDDPASSHQCASLWLQSLTEPVDQQAWLYQDSAVMCFLASHEQRLHRVSGQPSTFGGGRHALTLDEGEAGPGSSMQEAVDGGASGMACVSTCSKHTCCTCLTDASSILLFPGAHTLLHTLTTSDH